LQLYHSTHIEDILTTAEISQPDLIIIDSIQTVYSEHTDSSAGSPNQVKYCSEKLSEYGKQNNCTVIIIGHVTKGGEIAGPKYLEHIVDVVLYLEGDRFGQLRFLRSQKNRFGHTDDSGIFEMTLFGLQPVYDIKDRILQAASTMP
jgi:DNA repair protein RadA/Sms